MLLTHYQHDRPGDHWSPGGRAARIVALGLLVVGGLVTATACSTASSPPRPSSATGLPAAALVKLHSLPPIYARVYTWSASGQRISLAQQRLATACMAQHGFRYQPAPPATAEDMAHDNPMPFGLESVESLTSPSTTGTSAAPTEDPTKSAKYSRALLGDPTRLITARGAQLTVSRPATGCLAEAEQRLLGTGRARWIQLRILLFEAEQESLRQVNNDPGFRAVNARWQQCMHKAGFSWSDPQQLLNGLPRTTDLRTHPATRADVRCKNETGYLAVAYPRLAAVQQGLLNKDPKVLADWTTLLLRQDRAAQRVLANN